MTELDYLKKEAAEYEQGELTEEEQDEVDAAAMQANVQAWDGARLERSEENLDLICNTCGKPTLKEDSKGYLRCNTCYPEGRERFF